ncbi:hypothetical protein BD1_19 [Octadecabacter Antarctic BD virus 1]|nr:hypothetical protein BD1_19 [Octadecabacter Antarctic BD virus 1]
MSFTPHNYLTTERALGQIATDATSYYANVTRAIEQLDQSVAKLSGMAGEWSAAVAFVRAAAKANPDDKHWQDASARMNKLIVDFADMKKSATSIRDAANAAR